MSFNFVAPYYDRLVRLAFGSKLFKAQQSLLNTLPKNANVLIIGGGTGLITRQVVEQINPQKIFYVDSSERMIQLAQKNNRELKNVEYISQSIFEWTPKESLDVVITPFFLDLLSEKEIDNLLRRVAPYLRSGSNWLNIDFREGGFKQKVLLKLMFVFFQITAGMNQSELVEPEPIFLRNNFRMMDRKLFSNPDLVASKYTLK